MADLQFNIGSTQKQVPINRNNLFFSEESFQFERELGKNYIEQDMNQTLVLYQVDIANTQTDALYGETTTSNVMYKAPVEFHCVYTIAEPELKSYDKTKNLGTYMKTGNITFGVYQETLDELEAEIRVGDYIGCQVSPTHMEYFCVTNDGRNNYNNSISMYGYKALYRRCEAAPVSDMTTEFNG